MNVGYDSRSRRTDLNYVNGAYADYSYDAASRLLVLDNQTNSGYHKYTYTYDYVGNRMGMTANHNGVTGVHVYSYDDIYQLTGVNYPEDFDPNLATDATFNYDAAGNRTSVIDGSGTCTYTSNTLNQYTDAGPDSFQYDDSGNMWADGHNVYTFDPENRLLTARPSGQSPPPGSALAEAVDSGLSYTTGGDANWQKVSYPAHYGDDSAEGTAWQNGNSWLQTTVEGEGTLKFWWKVSSESGGDYLEFYINDQLQHAISGTEGDWAEKTYTLGSGTHTLGEFRGRHTQFTTEISALSPEFPGIVPELPFPHPSRRSSIHSPKAGVFQRNHMGRCAPRLPSVLVPREMAYSQHAAEKRRFGGA